MLNILVLNGPNLNMLGKREPDIYGHLSLVEIEQLLIDQLPKGFSLTFKQSNHEGQLIDWIQEAPKDHVDIIIINPAGFTHTSIALRDAFLGIKVPFIEVHLSNTHARKEEIRKRSFLSDIALGVIMGFGPLGYTLALQAALAHITTPKLR